MNKTHPSEEQSQVLVTRNTEYHILDHTCVAVRNRDGELSDRHAAVGGQVIGLVKADGGYDFSPDPQPTPGARLCFSTDLVTSPIANVRRPRPQTLEAIRKLERKGH